MSEKQKLLEEMINELSKYNLSSNNRDLIKEQLEEVFDNMTYEQIKDEIPSVEDYIKELLALNNFNMERNAKKNKRKKFRARKFNTKRVFGIFLVVVGINIFFEPVFSLLSLALTIIFGYFGVRRLIRKEYVTSLIFFTLAYFFLTSTFNLYFSFSTLIAGLLIFVGIHYIFDKKNQDNFNKDFNFEATKEKASEIANDILGKTYSEMSYIEDKKLVKIISNLNSDYFVLDNYDIEVINIESNLSDLKIDLTKVITNKQNLNIVIKNSLGDVTILVPTNFNVKMQIKNSLADSKLIQDKMNVSTRDVYVKGENKLGAVRVKVQ